MIKIRPFLKWAGSKYNCLDKILPFLPSGKRLIEPFAGSGAVFINTHYSQHVLAERNADIIALFSALQHHGETFINHCEYYFNPHFNNKDRYYEVRTQFNNCDNPQERAILFLYLNRHGYNGLCRYNSKGSYNVPFGLYTKPYFPRKEMLYFYARSKTTQFFYQDFRETFKQAQPGDVIYCDPPYVPLNDKTKLLPYNQKLFSNEDQIELKELALASAAKGIPVIISNHDTEFTRYHYQDALIKSFYVPRFINCQSSLRQPVKELLAIYS